MSETVAAALDGIDRAFGPRTGRTAPVDGCRHCYTEEELARLSGPAGQIAEAELFDAVFSWGNTLDDSVAWLRWVTPRLMRDMMETGQLLDDEMVAVRLHKAEWREWPPAERQAIETLCSAWWRTALAGPVDEWPVTGALAFLVPLTREIAPWLEIWTRTPGRSADLQVAELWREWGQQILAGELDISVYVDGPNIAPDLADWLLRHGAARLADGDLDELSAWSLAQLPLPAEERWR
ncbi:hypothetical protein ABH926_003061 [Catenulispora sp. GP43]|uniref:hypothetical protein n=1 Tax=Catenulispora sp. GP43 TaxID=3156263 RepID=UPI0035124C3E